ncbi:MAG: 23S rRNA (guanosine(2251)-2'-O)-methyltransferase RlmB [Desulfobacterota bacterium]|nr:23S rRNA (guanosine(2251)-2'-O)-methyltransferase RlmB [Thermodesulfobacteriota bacterium]MDW8002020.1 23S rRNA (guanosine(2251)-2'-O)-methyltransferase RlmB [Deltaproteobacteria bacterium]
MPYLIDKDDIRRILEQRPSSARRLYVEKEKAYLASKFIELAKMKGVQFKLVPEAAIKAKIKSKGVHFFLEVEPCEYLEPEKFLELIRNRESPLIFAFDGIYDPQNFGNILRSAGSFKVDGIIVPKDRSCPVTERVIEISKGGYKHVKLVRVTNLPRYLETLKDLDVAVFGLDEDGETAIYDVDLTKSSCLVLGREDGLRSLTRKKCDKIIKIPTSRDFPSLNLASCFAIALYEAKRQRSLRSI